MEESSGFSKELFSKLEGMKFSRPQKQAAEKTTTGQIQIKYEEKKVDSKPSPEKPQSFDKDNKKNFDWIYKQIEEMRKERNAPVDEMGCQMNADPSASEEVRNFQMLISLVLSVQTRDEKTYEAMNNLKAKTLTLENIHKMSEEEIREEIKMVNYYNNKAKYMKSLAKVVLEQHNGKLPDKLSELIKLPGIGYKIAVIYINHAVEKGFGIGVDTHVHRISNRLGLVETKSPDLTRTALESFVDKKYWHELNVLLVGFGQQICLPLHPKCEDCLLNKICPEGKSNVNFLNPKLKKVKKTTDKDSMKSSVTKDTFSQDVSLILSGMGSQKNENSQNKNSADKDE